MSLDRRLSVLPSVMISVRELGTPAPMVKLLPGAPAELIESIPGEVHVVEGIHDRPRAKCQAGGQPGFEDPLGSARGHVQEPRGATAIVDGRQIQDDGDVPVPMRGVAPHVSTLWALVAAHAHMQDRGAPPAGLMRQAPDYRATRNALASAASTPLVLTSNTASQHCMV